ncbi:carbohydrate-binding module family 1 protein, partial [Bipolaris zeicola 26-R-13]
NYDGSYGSGHGNSDSVSLFGRCGGKGYTGPTTCRYGRCVAFNPWFSMCI